MTVSSQSHGWSDERVEALKQLWADGLSATEIAAELGHLTRSAVIGKIHRLNLPGRRVGRRSAKPHAPRVQRSYGGPPRIFVPRAKAAPKPPRERKEPAMDSVPLAPTTCKPVLLLDLAADHCRYPLWNGAGKPTAGEMLFCGAAPKFDSSYCAWHHRIVYTPPAPRSAKAGATA